jgi:hypothetical protein
MFYGITSIISRLMGDHSDIHVRACKDREEKLSEHKSQVISPKIALLSYAWSHSSKELLSASYRPNPKPNMATIHWECSPGNLGLKQA